MGIPITRELVKLKHDVLIKRIEKIEKDLRIISIVVNCDNEIKSIELIKEQYEKMYQAILDNEGYDKYREVEDFIISKLSQIEKVLDKIIYRTAQRFDEVLQNHIKTSRESEEYKKFYKLDKELEKIKLLKTLLKYCSIYFTKAQESRINTEISTFKFELLIRRQIEQMVYQNGTVHDGRGYSRLNLYDCREEKNIFYALIEKMIEPFKEDEIIKGYNIEQIATRNILLNHLLFRIIEQDIEVNTERYIGLLEAKIFNPHMCNIVNDPFPEEIPYLEITNRRIEEYLQYLDDPLKWNFYTRKKANFSLLKAVLEQAISDLNTTIMECDSIFKMFGFECRPIVVSEGQEIIKRIYEKTKHTIKSSQEKKDANGKFIKIKFVGYDYYYSATEEYSFLTHAKMIKKVQDICAKKTEFDIQKQRLELWLGNYNYFMNFETMFLYDMEMAGERIDRILHEITNKSNDWIRKPLKKMGSYTKRPRRPSKRRPKYIGFGEVESIKEYDETVLWESYKSDFEEMGLTVEEIGYDTFEFGNEYFIAISLDDIGDLPIDFRKAEILTAEQLKKAKEEYEEER